MKGFDGTSRCSPRALRANVEGWPPTDARGSGVSTLVAVQDDMEIAVSVNTARQDAVRMEKHREAAVSRRMARNTKAIDRTCPRDAQYRLKM